MKQQELIRRLTERGCMLVRHGGRHDWYRNPAPCRDIVRSTKTWQSIFCRSCWT